MSLVEALVAITLMVAIVPIFVPLLISSTRSARSLGFQSQTLHQLRLTVANIGRELRSAECIYLPVANGPAGPTLRFKTNAFLSVTPDEGYEVTYTAAPGELRRKVAGLAPTIAATGLVPLPVTVRLPGQEDFDVFQQVVTPRRSVKLVFHIQADPDTPVRDVTTTIAGRNAWRDC